MYRCFFLAVATSAILAPAFAGPLEDGESALKNSDYVVALDRLKPLADRGNPKAQLDLGSMYLGGLGVVKDPSKANDWFRKAAERGNIDAQRQLAAGYFTGRFGLPKDIDQAMSWYHRAAEHGDLPSITLLADFYLRGASVPRNIGEALHWYRKAADLGDVRSMNNLGSIYLSGDDGHAKDARLAFHWFSKAAEHGNGGAELALGDLYRQGEGVHMDKAQALAWYRKAAAQGDVMKAVADQRIASLERGEPLVPPPSPPPANFAALTAQAEHGDAQAQTDLGNIYLDPHSVLSDPAKGVSWLHKAADQGFAPAEKALSDAYCVGWGGAPKNVEECRSWLQRAADQGYAQAEYSLGLSYFTGMGGVEKDNAQGMQWLQRAANQGYADAEQQLGWEYEIGHRTFRDFDKAIQWYRKAADQGDTQAQMSLGEIYERGKGVPRDTAQALDWYKMAAASSAGTLLQTMARSAIKRLEASRPEKSPEQ